MRQYNQFKNLVKNQKLTRLLNTFKNNLDKPLHISELKKNSGITDDNELKEKILMIREGLEKNELISECDDNYYMYKCFDNKDNFTIDKFK